MIYTTAACSAYQTYELYHFDLILYFDLFDFGLLLFVCKQCIFLEYQKLLKRQRGCILKVVFASLVFTFLVFFA